ncbi:pseudouridine synthase [Emericellopsis atlantica]|uniref:Pseudouridine synthase n=1 Tax=Emericellopsis atlantica TaxID=2614577 RepID=A0A9P7ZU18_9HYPO|nr:pseudouridine synthase [Emericellopsis atlantica]KAG9257675.1 pseudouridine synthase [Emericellopsis atlantica]
MEATKLPDDYDKWTKDSLIKRLREIDAHAKREGSSLPVAPPTKKRKDAPKLDAANYNTRYIALKLAYLGRNYGAFEYAASTATPSIEEELFKALTKACLIFPKDPHVVDFSGCEYSKCGRTDRGVSAFGQVIALRVRSARPVPGKKPRKEKKKKAAEQEAADKPAPEPESEAVEPPPFDPIKDEIAYARVLNRILPADIRVMAWCPSPPEGFSARFSCQEREYRYFFTQPAYNPPMAVPHEQKHPGWLDIEAMKDAAKRFEGDQDFRNFCKVDPAKNITNYRRFIMEAGIYEADDMSSHFPLPGREIPTDVAPGLQKLPKVYYFKVRGTAFLWHQIRHMIAILFNVGQGLETPDIVDRLLDVENNPRRPTYTMADEVPLVLWDCKFVGEGAARDPEASEKNLDWLHADDEVDSSKNALSVTLGDSAWRVWRDRKMDEILANGFLQMLSRKPETATVQVPDVPVPKTKPKPWSTQRFEGGNGARLMGTYIPVMDMLKMETPQEQSDRYAKRKGYISMAELNDAKYGSKQDKMDEDTGE